MVTKEEMMAKFLSRTFTKPRTYKPKKTYMKIYDYHYSNLGKLVPWKSPYGRKSPITKEIETKAREWGKEHGAKNLLIATVIHPGEPSAWGADGIIRHGYEEYALFVLNK